jgi:hypothetical protein
MSCLRGGREKEEGVGGSKRGKRKIKEKGRKRKMKEKERDNKYDEGERGNKEE